MKKKKKRKIVEGYIKSKREKISEALDLPKDLILNLPRLIFTGNRELYIEQYRGIVEYGDDFIKLSVGGLMLCVRGQGIEIRCITGDEIVLGGNIRGFDFI